MNRSPLGRGKPLARKAALDRSSVLARRTQLARGASTLNSRVPASSRRQRGDRADDIPQEARDLVRTRSGGHCEARCAGLGDTAGPRCGGDATDVHHRKRRRDGGHTVPNLLHLCRACHQWVHAHPVPARRFGWIVSAFADPAVEPVLVASRLAGRGRRVLLTDGGEYL